MEVVLSPENNDPCRAHPRSIQHSGGCRVEAEHRTKRLEAGQGSVYQTTRGLGSLRHRSVCGQTQQTTSPLLQLQAGPRIGGCGCSSSALVGAKTVCLPSFHTNREMPPENCTGSSERNGTDSTGVAEPDMVSKPASQTCRLSNPIAKLQGADHKPNGGHTSISRTEQSTSSRLQSFRANVQVNDISDESFKVLSAAWRRGTEKSYSSAWGKWILWCNRTNTNPFPSSVGPVLNFLTEQFREGIAVCYHQLI